MQHSAPFNNVEQLYEEVECGGEISLCSLSAIIPDKLNLVIENGDFTKESMERYEEACYYALKKIDNTIEIMDYPFPHLKMTAQARRNAGVGIIGLAYDLANRGLTYTSAEGKRYIHMLAELHMYSLIKASLLLSYERGVCEWANRTKWVDGWLPIDTYNKNVDKVVDSTLLRDWESLRKDVIENKGHRFSFLVAHMPTESSSIAADRPNSVYPVRNLVVIKGDGDDSKIFIATEAERLKNSYQIAWDISAKQMVDVYAILQKFCDQGISVDKWIKRTNNEKVTPRFSALDMLDNWCYARHMGIKSGYYTNSQNSGGRVSGREVVVEDESCVGGGCKL